MSTAVTKERVEKAKEQILLAQSLKQNLASSTSVDVEKVPEVTPPPFGGGTLVGLIINPTPADVQALTGYDKYDFSQSRSYGGSLYLPLQRYCSQLVESSDPVDRMTGYAHLGDRFVVKRDSTPSFSEAEESLWRGGQQVGQSLLDRGARPWLTFPTVSVFGAMGQEVLKGHYIPSCGYAQERLLQDLLDFFKNPEEWLKVTRVAMRNLAKQISNGTAAPIRGYEA